MRICSETVHDYLKDFSDNQKLKPANGGSQSRLIEELTESIVKPLDIQTYTKVSDICSYGEGNLWRSSCHGHKLETGNKSWRLKEGSMNQKS